MDIFESHFYRVNVGLLKIMAQWPYDNGRKRRMHQIIFHITIFTVAFAQGIRMVEIWGDLDIMIECFTPICVQLTSLCKTINCMMNRKNVHVYMKSYMEHPIDVQLTYSKYDFRLRTWNVQWMFNYYPELKAIECLPMDIPWMASLCIFVAQEMMLKLVETMKNDWSKLKKLDEVKILTSYAEQGRRLTLFYTVFLLGSMTLYLIIPLMPRILNVILPRNQSRPVGYLYHSQYYVDPEEYFYPILVHTYVGTIITITGVVATDSMYATYVQHVCGIIAIVGHRLEQLGEETDLDVDVNPSKNDDKCYWELMTCIDQHFQAIEFACLIESSHNAAYLLQVGAGIVMLSFSGVQILIKFGQYEEMIRLIQFTLAQLGHLLFASWPGQKLIDQCNKLRHSIYCVNWYCSSLRSRKLLAIMMLRSITPQKITAGKLYDMTMENYGKVVQTSASYFTVFASLR